MGHTKGILSPRPLERNAEKRLQGILTPITDCRCLRTAMAISPARGVGSSAAVRSTAPLGFDKGMNTVTVVGDEKRCDELPFLCDAPRTTHHPCVGCHAQELVQDRPGGIPGISLGSLAFEPSLASRMKGCVRVRCIHQYIGIDNDH